MNKDATLKFIDEQWEDWYIDGIKAFIRIPNLSPSFDPEYQTNGLIEQTIALVDDYARRLEIVGLERHFFQEAGQNPLIVYVVESTQVEGQAKNVMFYGHLDKQPYDEPWEEGLSPTEPVIRDGLLYGRGGYDDGYAVFSSLLAIKNAQMQGVPLPRTVICIETEEESGSENLIDLLAAAADVIKIPDICFPLDSGCLDYEKLWMTSSLRGFVEVDLKIECGLTGYHSGEVGGLVPETCRILRILLDRLDDIETGYVAAEFHSEIPEWKHQEATVMVESQGASLYEKFPLHAGVQHMSLDDLEKQYLDTTWRPNLTVCGASGFPEVAKAGNVVRPATEVRLSIRLDPLMDAKLAMEHLMAHLTTNVPYNAKVTVTNPQVGTGWCQREPPTWLGNAVNEAGLAFFDKPASSYGEGGSIPFLTELEGIYPNTQIIAFGVGGPFSNAHAPNENLNLPYAKKLTCSLSHILASCAQN